MSGVGEGKHVRRCHVIVGAGASGLVLAKRLLDAEYNVILIERGTEDADRGRDVQDPLDWGFAATDPAADSEATRALTLPQPGLWNRQLLAPQGRGFGGSTNMNACIWSAGHRGVFDSHWPPSWNADMMDGYLSAVIDLLQPSVVTPCRGSMAESILRRGDLAAAGPSSGGSAACSPQQQVPVLESAWSAQPHGGYYSTATSSSGHSTRARLKNWVLDHNKTARGGKLLVHSSAEAEFIVFQGQRAVGVHVRLSNGTQTLIEPHGGGEIILCAGVYESPRILLASGLKAPELRSPACVAAQTAAQARHQKLTQQPPPQQTQQSAAAARVGGQKPRGPTPAELHMLGQNLQDHVVLPLLCLGNWWGRAWQPEPAPASTVQPKPSLWARAWSVCAGLHKVLHLRTDKTLPPNSVHGWIDLDAEGNVFNPQVASAGTSPSAQLVFIDGRMAPGIAVELLLPRLPRSGGACLYIYSLLRPVLAPVLQLLMRLSPVQWLCGFFFGFLVCLTRPSSRGRLVLAEGTVVGKAKPLLEAPLEIDPCYFQDRGWMLRGESEDAQILYNAMHTAHGLLEEARQHDGLTYIEVLPGLPFGHCRARDYFQSYLSLFASSYYHPCGTCQMSVNDGDDDGDDDGENGDEGGTAKQEGQGAPARAEVFPVLASSASDAEAVRVEAVDDATTGATSARSARGRSRTASSVGGRKRKPLGVVDESLRVNGVSGLRVADASVFPCIPSGPIAAVCMAVGEAAFRFLMLEDRRIVGEDGKELA